MISIIIPSRNRAELAARALAGIQIQSYSDYEVIFVDDGSDELTRQAYQAIWAGLDQRYKIIYAAPPADRGSGPSITRNLGVIASSGEILAFCDDDDFWCDPEHLSRMASEFSEIPSLGIYIGNQRAVTVDGQAQSDWLPGLSSRTQSRSKTAYGSVIVNHEDLCKAGGFAHLNMLALKRSVVEEIQGFWERISYEEDRDFFWRAADAASVILFNDIVVAQHNVPDHRQRTNLSTAHSTSERLMFSLLVSQHIVSNVKSRSIARLAGSYSGDLLRRLSLSASESKKSYSALIFARQALAARFSLKWAIYVLMMATKSIFRSSRT